MQHLHFAAAAQKRLPEKRRQRNGSSIMSHRPFITTFVSSSLEKNPFSSAMMAHYVNYFTSFACNFPVVDKQIAAAANLRYPSSGAK